jgi:hypothetical protein
MSQTLSQALEAQVYGDSGCETKEANEALFVKCQDVLCRLSALSSKNTPDAENSVFDEVMQVSLEKSGGHDDALFRELLKSNEIYCDYDIAGNPLGDALNWLRDFLGDFEIGIPLITLDVLRHLPALPHLNSAAKQVTCYNIGVYDQTTALASAILDCIFDYLGFNDPFDTYVKSAAKT